MHGGGNWAQVDQLLQITMLDAHPHQGCIVVGLGWQENTDVMGGGVIPSSTLLCFPGCKWAQHQALPCLLWRDHS